MIKYSPYYLSFLWIFGSLISYLFKDVPYIEIIDYIPVIFVIIALIVITFKKRSGLFLKSHLILWLWISYLAVHFLISIAMGIGISRVLIGLYQYIIPCVYWYLFISVYRKKFSVNSYLRFLLLLSVVVSIIGIYQYFFDVSLFGFAASLHNRYSLENYSKYSVLRITSVFTSIQILSCFLLLGIVLLFENNKMFKKGILFVSSAVMFIAGVLTGSRLFITGMIIYLIIKIITFNKLIIKKSLIYKLLFISLLFSLFASAVFIINPRDINNSTITRALEPLVNIEEFISNEFNDSSDRYNIYSNALSNNNNIIIGNGIGIASSISNQGRIAIESYLLQIIVELGIVGFFIYIIFFIVSYKKKEIDIKHKSMVMILLFTMAFNQAFVSVVFIPYYIFLIYPIMSINGNKKITSLNVNSNTNFEKYGGNYEVLNSKLLDRF